VDIKSLLANDRSLSTADNNSISRLLNENDLLIFPSYATIEWTKSSDSLSINYLTDTDLINIHKGKLDEINKNIISLRSGWVNLKHSKDNYYVTKIIKKKKEMILYFFTGATNKTFLKDMQLNSEITDIFYTDIEFVPGTYLIDLSNRKMHYKCLLKKYRFDRGSTYLVITGNEISLSKISDLSISPNELQKFYKDKKLKKTTGVTKILSVF